MRTVVPIVVMSVLTVVFVLLAPERGWSDLEALVGLVAIMLVVGGLGWHSPLLDRLGPRL
jgi:hypothetical protein